MTLEKWQNPHHYFQAAAALLDTDSAQQATNGPPQRCLHDEGSLGRTRPFSSSKRLPALSMSRKVENCCLPRHPQERFAGQAWPAVALREKGEKVPFMEHRHPLCLVGCSEGRLQDTSEGEDPSRSGGIELEMNSAGLGN